MLERLMRLSFLWSYAARWKREIITALLSLTVVSLTSLIYPWLLKLMVDSLSGTVALPADLGWIVGALVFLFALSTVLGYRQQLTMHSLGYRLRNALRMDLYQILLYRPLSFHRSQQVGELSARITEDISKVQPVFVSLVAPVFQSVLVIGGALLLSLYLNWVATIVLVLFMILPFPVMLRYSRKIRALGSASQAQHARANAHFDETLVGIREIKAFTREEGAIRTYAAILREAFGTETEASEMVIRGNQSAYFLLSMTLLTMLYLAAVSAIPGWTIGSMVAFYFYAYTMVTALLSVGRIYLTFQSVSGALERVKGLLSSHERERTNVGGTISMKSGSVLFEDVAFGYSSDAPVFLNLSFAVPEGGWTVVGGPSGSGKSTIASLIMGFYTPWAGRILVEGHPLDQWDIRSLRQQIGYVGQDPILFHGTMRENLLIPEAGADREYVARCLDVACLEEVIGSLPDGLETVVGERGYTLSGGQEARVAIARALLRNPVLLILDEATSMLEPELERRLWERLVSMREGRTTIVLSHHPGNIPPVFRHLLIEKTDNETRMRENS